MPAEEWVTPDEIARILSTSEPGDELKVNYQNQDGSVIAFILGWNCNTWALRVLKVIRNREL